MDTLEIRIHCPEDYFEILIEALDKKGYEAFWEEDEFLLCYIPESKFDREALQDVVSTYLDHVPNTFEIQRQEKKNWNQEWEKNYDPVDILNKYYIRAPFHAKRPDLKEFIIHPKMAFGTGHHQTTELMIRLQDEMDFKHKTVFDYGSGTGILSIFAAFKGAQSVLGIDIEPEAIASGNENAILNGYPEIKFLQSDIHSVKGQFDIILANITRNILLDTSKNIAKLLNQSGELLLSGFFEEDIEILENEFTKYGLHLHSYLEKDHWAACKFVF